jgi:hypothetical protein
MQGVEAVRVAVKTVPAVIANVWVVPTVPITTVPSVYPLIVGIAIAGEDVSTTDPVPVIALSCADVMPEAT